MDIQTRVTQFVEKLKPLVDTDTIELQHGRKYIRVVRQGYSRSVYCFIDTTNGNILKSASWKQPANKGIRGNIFEEDYGIHCCSRYSLKYLR